MRSEEVDYVIYHRPCVDGFGAAFAAYHYLSKIPDKQVTYHGSAPFKQYPDDIQNKNVVLLDLCYPINQIKEMLTIVKSLLIIDHHKTSQAAMKDIPDENKIFDMTKSGAVLSWEFFHPSTPVPLFFQYIQDRDLFTKKLPNIDQFATMSQILPFEFKSYEKYLDDNLLLTDINNKGLAYRELVDYYVVEAAKKATVKFLEVKDRFYMVAHMNETGLYNSDVANKILEFKPYADFSVVYKTHPYGTSLSLRSDDTRADVSKVATLLGGGGHRNASGCGVSTVTDSLPFYVVDNSGKVYQQLRNIYFGDLTIGTTHYNVVYLNTNHCRWRISKYLLQQTDQNTQQVQFIMSKQRNLTIDKQQIAALWYYDGVNTNFSVVLGPEYTDEQKKEIYKQLNIKENEYLVYAGLRTDLNMTYDRANNENDEEDN